MSSLARITNWAERAEAANYKVKALALGCGVSVRQLERFFRQTTGMSPHQFLAQLRQMRALALLRLRVRVKEAADELGYEHPANLSRAFKAYHGQPPRHFHSASPPAPG